MSPKPSREVSIEFELEQRYGVPFVDLKTFRVDPEFVSMLPEDFLRSRQVCPLFRAGNTIALAMADPRNTSVIDEVRRMTGLEIEPMVCRLVDLQQALNQCLTSSAEPPLAARRSGPSSDLARTPTAGRPSAPGGWRIAYVRCLRCSYDWVQYSTGQPGAPAVAVGKPVANLVPTIVQTNACPSCGSSECSEPVYLGKVRRSYEILEEDHRSGCADQTEYGTRKELLTRLYLQAARTTLRDVNRLFVPGYADFLSARLSDDLFNRLVFLASCFNELGMPVSSASCCTMLALGYALRGMVAEVTKEDDLTDLKSSLRWFELLANDEWQATLHVEIGYKAGHAVRPRNTQEKEVLVNLAIVHMNSAQNIYSRTKQTDLVSVIDREKGRLDVRLGGLDEAVATVEAANIKGEYTVKAAKDLGDRIRDGLEAQGREIAQGLHEGLSELGQFVQKGLTDVATGVRMAGASIAMGTESGLFEIGRSIRVSTAHATEVAQGSLRTLGNKLALGLLGGAAVGSLVLRDGMMNLGESVSSSLASASATLANPVDNLINTAIPMGLEALKRIGR